MFIVHSLNDLAVKIENVLCPIGAPWELWLHSGATLWANLVAFILPPHLPALPDLGNDLDLLIVGATLPIGRSFVLLKLS